MAQVKICGVNSPEALEAAAEAGADWVGFVFFPASPRAIAPAQAKALSAGKAGGPKRVGLFVDPGIQDVESALRTVQLDVLQVYASPARAAELRARFGVPVWNAVGVQSRADLPTSAPGVDGMVIEAKPPQGATRPGGNALALDWSILQGWNAPGPWLLAGGLTPENVADAIAATGASAVDVSSGVERARGVKDAGLIRAFIAAAKPAPSGRA